MRHIHQWKRDRNRECECATCGARCALGCGAEHHSAGPSALANWLMEPCQHQRHAGAMIGGFKCELCGEVVS